jgi:hypothetical protein
MPPASQIMKEEQISMTLSLQVSDYFKTSEKHCMHCNSGRDRTGSTPSGKEKAGYI